MMMEDDSSNNSPFDVALAKPFLEEPAKKKWSISLPLSPSSFLRRSSVVSSSTRRTSTTSIMTDMSENTSSIFGDDFEDDDNNDEEKRPLIRELQSPTSVTSILEDGLSNQNNNKAKSLSPLVIPSIADDKHLYGNAEDDNQDVEMMELVPLKSSSHTLISLDDDVESGVGSGGIDALALKSMLKTQDGDVAIMTERNSELTGIASSMRQINEIQKDFATVVDSQGDAIQQLSWQSIEAFGHAQSGLEHLVKTVKTTKKRKENVFSLLVSGMVVLAFCYVAAGIIASDFGIGGGASSFDGGEGHAEEGSPKFLIPINMIATP